MEKKKITKPVVMQEHEYCPEGIMLDSRWKRKDGKWYLYSHDKSDMRQEYQEGTDGAFKENGQWKKPYLESLWIRENSDWKLKINNQI